MANKFKEINNNENYDLHSRLDKKTQLKPKYDFNGKRFKTISISVTQKNFEYLEKLVDETGAKSRTAVLETLVDIYYDRLFNE